MFASRRTLVGNDGVGNKITSTDQMNQVTTYSYNVAGQILTVTEPAVTAPNSQLLTPISSYTYDQFGDQISGTTASGNVAGGNPAAYTTTYAYDQFGSQISKTLPMGQVASTTYDGFGRTLTATDAAGRVTLYVYDNPGAPGLPNGGGSNLGRLYGKYYFATTADYQAYIADPAGSTQPNETIVYAYNALGLETGITDTLITPASGDPRSPYTNVTTFAYDSNNNVVQESGPSGTISYVYNQATQRHTETWTGTSYANAVSDIVYGYNNMGELASVTVVKESGVGSS